MINAEPEVKPAITALDKKVVMNPRRKSPIAVYRIPAINASFTAIVWYSWDVTVETVWRTKKDQVEFNEERSSAKGK